jgi:hypothetical protein
MNGELESFGFEVVMVLGAGAALLALLLGVRALIELAPLDKDRRETIDRAGPVVAAITGVVYLAFAVRALFAHPLLVALVLLGFAVAAWSAIRDFVSGMFIKAGRVCREGDTVRLDGVHGRITTMGYRVMVVETHEGDEAIIPYSKIAREQLLRTPVADAVSPHVFKLRAPVEGVLHDVKTAIRQSALLTHWSVPSRNAAIAVQGDGTLEVTVYAVDPDRGEDIEAEVRRAMGRFDSSDRGDEVALDGPIVDLNVEARQDTVKAKL